MRFGNGVPEGVFTKILNGMLSGVLSEEATVDALSALSSVATEDEWAQWYLPILEKRLRLPVTLTLFNKHCPKEHRVTNINAVEFESVGEVLPTKFILEPYINTTRLLVVLTQTSTFVFEADGTPVHRMLPKVLERFVGAEPVVLEMYEEAESYIVRDVLLWDQFTDPDTYCVPVEKRMGVLRTMLGDADGIEVIEQIEHTGEDSIRDDISAFFQAGYPGVVFRPLGLSYHAEHANMLVHPVRKSVLTCTKIEAGAAGTKYEDRAEYIYGRGTMNRKKFESPVFHGLTFSERGTSLEGQAELVGKRFDIVSCGLDTNGKLIFPVFKQWKP